MLPALVCAVEWFGFRACATAVEKVLSDCTEPDCPLAER